jgi:hypothetical protein
MVRKQQRTVQRSMNLDHPATAWQSVLTNLEAVSLYGGQEGGEPNLTLQVQADLIVSNHQPLSCQLHRQTQSMSESVLGDRGAGYTHTHVCHDSIRAKQLHAQGEQSIQ